MFCKVTHYAGSEHEGQQGDKMKQKSWRISEMNIQIKAYDRKDIDAVKDIWNTVVEDGVAFPQKELLDADTGHLFFSQQSFTGVAFDGDTGEIVGMYILHPNNVGRCGHICNASYAVKKDLRGHHIGEHLVRHCMKKAKELGYGILQFNAVVRTNLPALALYQKLGFTQLGVIPKGFQLKSGEYEDIIPHYIEL